MYKDGKYDQIIMLGFETLPENRILNGDTIDVYGTSWGIHDYETIDGNTNQVPFVNVDTVLIKGYDY